MWLILLITWMHLLLFSLCFSLALLLNYQSTIKELAGTKIDFDFDTVWINSLLNFVSIIIPKKTIMAFVSNKDLRIYLFMAVGSGLLAYLLYHKLDL